MIKTMKTTIRIFCLIVFALLYAVASNSQQHKGLNFQALLKAPNGELPSDANLNIKAQILSTDNCILREESFSNVPMTRGYINLVLGTGTVGGADPGLLPHKAFDNSSTINNLVCLNSDQTVKNDKTSFIPNQTNGSRKLRLNFEVAGEALTSEFNIRAVAYSVNSETLNGKTNSDFIQISNHITQERLENFLTTLTSANGNAVKWNGSTFTSYDPTSGTNLANNSVPSTAITSLDYNKLTSIPAPLNQIGNLNCADGKILKKTSGSWSCSDQTTITFGTTAGTAAEGNDARITGAFQTNTALNGDLSGTLASPQVQGIKGQTISAAGNSAGQYLRYTGSNTWTPSFIAMTDLRSSITGVSSFASSCSAKQTLTYNSVGDVMSCTDITGVPAANITGLAASATTNTTNADNITLGTLNASRLPSSITNAMWSESSGDVSRPTGRVSIGTSTSSAKLTINTTNEDYISFTTSDTTGGGNTASITYKLKASPAETSTSDTVSRGRLEFKSESIVDNGDTITGTYTFDGNVGIGDTSPNTRLAVAGAIKMGNTTATCDVTSEGQQRYNSTLKRMEFCDGLHWQSLGSPSGAVQAFSQTTCPNGWLEANGNAISRTTYATLFASISTSYGVGDGSTTFNLPDYRGYFLRGWDHGAAVDPDSTSRTDRGDGVTGDAVGTKQASSNKSGSISVAIPVDATASDNNVPADTAVLGKGLVSSSAAKIYSSSSATTTLKPFNVSTTGAAESRPNNINVLYCIKY